MRAYYEDHLTIYNVKDNGRSILMHTYTLDLLCSFGSLGPEFHHDENKPVECQITQTEGRGFELTHMKKPQIVM